MISYFQAVVIGLLQGVTELFPVSSLGHSVLIPSLFGWNKLAAAQSRPESFYLAFLVGLHVATALVLIFFFREDWGRIIRGLFQSVRTLRVDNGDQRVAWLIVIASIPAGLTGLLLEHRLRTPFAKPLAASIFLAINGVILLAGERARRSARRRSIAAAPIRPTSALATVAPDGTRELSTLGSREAGIVGIAQTGALCAGISRSGITMVAGLLRVSATRTPSGSRSCWPDLSSWPLACTKLPDLAGPLGNGIRRQVLAGSGAAALAAWFAVRFLNRWFRTKTLTPFGMYCLVAGTASAFRFGLL